MSRVLWLLAAVALAVIVLGSFTAMLIFLDRVLHGTPESMLAQWLNERSERRRSGRGR